MSKRSRAGTGLTRSPKSSSSSSSLSPPRHSSASPTAKPSTEQLRSVNPPHQISKKPKLAKTTAVIAPKLPWIPEEIWLRCLSYCEPHDLLIHLSIVNTVWYRLSNDNQIWKSLYLRTFAPNSNRSTSTISSLQRTRPWKDLYKISFNWRRGHAKTSTISHSLRKAILPSTEDILPPPPPPPRRDPISVSSSSRIVRPFSPTHTPTRFAEASSSTAAKADTLIEAYKQFFFMASRSTLAADAEGPIPSVSVHQTLPSGGAIIIGRISSPRLADRYRVDDYRPIITITCIRLDQSERTSLNTRLIIFLSTGQFSFFSISLPSSTTAFECKEIHTCESTTSSFWTPVSSNLYDPIIEAKFNGALLVTVTKSFIVKFYTLITDQVTGQIDLIEHQESLQSFHAFFSPLSLTLEPMQSSPDTAESYKALLIYSTPIFPSQWSISIQQFLIDVPTHSQPLKVISQNASAPLHSISPAGITAIDQSNGNVVVSREDNTIQIYRVHTSPLPALKSISSSTRENRLSHRGAKLELLFIKNLFGHTGKVSKVAIEPNHSETGFGEKIVSASTDGTVKIWELLSSSAPASMEPVERRKTRGDRSVDVVDVSPQADKGNVLPQVERGQKRKREGTIWKALKSARKEKEHVVGLGFDSERIVKVVRGERGERVEVLRFD